MEHAAIYRLLCAQNWPVTTMANYTILISDSIPRVRVEWLLLYCSKRFGKGPLRSAGVRKGWLQKNGYLQMLSDVTLVSGH